MMTMIMTTTIKRITTKRNGEKIETEIIKIKIMIGGKKRKQQEKIINVKNLEVVEVMTTMKKMTMIPKIMMPVKILTNPRIVTGTTKTIQTQAMTTQIVAEMTPVIVVAEIQMMAVAIVTMAAEMTETNHYLS